MQGFDVVLREYERLLSVYRLFVDYLRLVFDTTKKDFAKVQDSDVILREHARFLSVYRLYPNYFWAVFESLF